MGGDWSEAGRLSPARGVASWDSLGWGIIEGVRFEVKGCSAMTKGCSARASSEVCWAAGACSVRGAGDGCTGRGSCSRLITIVGVGF